MQKGLEAEAFESRHPLAKKNREIAELRKQLAAKDRTIERMRELLNGILDNTRTVHLDMGGKHKYALTHKACPIISEAIVFMNEQYGAALKEG